jgi:HEPN domain-containing protein
MGPNRGFDWFRQSRDDLLWAKDTLKAGRFAQACFAAQQVGEKAIKALALKRSYTEVRSHSILEIASEHDRTASPGGEPQIPSSGENADGLKERDGARDPRKKQS